MAIRSFFRNTFRIIGYIFILTLPFTFQAYIAGALFTKYHVDRVNDGIRAFGTELEQFSWMNQFSVPGAPSIWDYQDNAAPFYVPKLRSNTWANKLGITLPYSHLDAFEIDQPIDKTVHFDGAVRDVSCRVGMPTEYWIYVSSLAMSEVFAWDKAFVQLLEYHEAHPLPDTAAFAFVDCGSAPLLCNVWQVGYPAMVHILVNETGSAGDNIDTSAFQSPPADLRPIEVRMFDLGLQLDTSPLLPGVFPTELEQMKALTTQDGAYSIAETYNEFRREYDRFNELVYFPACNRPGSFLDYSSEVDNWLMTNVAKPLGLEETADFVAAIAFSLSVIIGALFDLVARSIYGLYSSFLGQPTEFDHLVDRMEERQQVADNGGLFGNMAFDFVDFIEEQMSSSMAESADQPAVTTAQDELKSALAGLRANVSSIVKGA